MTDYSSHLGTCIDLLRLAPQLYNILLVAFHVVGASLSMAPQYLACSVVLTPVLICLVVVSPLLGFVVYSGDECLPLFTVCTLLGVWSLTVLLDRFDVFA